MQIQYKVNDSVTLIEEADTQVEAFKVLSGIHEVFGVQECGVCQASVYPRVRVVEDNAYHEMVCSNYKCKATLAYGQTKKGGFLFPKRRDKDGKWIPNNGFTRWVPGTEDTSADAKDSSKF